MNHQSRSKVFDEPKCFDLLSQLFLFISNLNSIRDFQIKFYKNLLTVEIKRKKQRILLDHVHCSVSLISEAYQSLFQ